MPHSQSNLLAFYCRVSVGRQQQHERGGFWRGAAAFKRGYKMRDKYADTLKSGPTGLQVNIMQSWGHAAFSPSKAPHLCLWTVVKNPENSSLHRPKC